MNIFHRFASIADIYFLAGAALNPAIPHIYLPFIGVIAAGVNRNTGEPCQQDLFAAKDAA